MGDIFSSSGVAQNAYTVISGDLTAFTGPYVDVGFKLFFSKAAAEFMDLQAIKIDSMPAGIDPFLLYPPAMKCLESLQSQLATYLDSLNRTIISYEYASKYNFFKS